MNASAAQMSEKTDRWKERAEAAEREVERLQAVIDSRPAINAGLPLSYIEWSHGIYAMEISHSQGRPS